MPPKLLDINVTIPTIAAPDADVSDVSVVDAGAAEPLERFTYIHFYASAMAVHLENRLAPVSGAQQNGGERLVG